MTRPSWAALDALKNALRGSAHATGCSNSSYVGAANFGQAEILLSERSRQVRLSYLCNYLGVRVAPASGSGPRQRPLIAGGDKRPPRKAIAAGR